MFFECININNRNGIAMVTVTLIIVFIMIIIGVALKLIVGGSSITGSSRRYFTVFDAAESGIEVGMLNIDVATRGGTTPQQGTVTIGDKNVQLAIEHIMTGLISGANIIFGGTGYEGIGTGISSGGVAIFFRIESESSGPIEEQVIIETVYRRIIGVTVR